MKLKLLTTVDKNTLTSFRCKPTRFIIWNDAPFVEAKLADVGTVLFPLLDVLDEKELKLYVYARTD